MRGLTPSCGSDCSAAPKLASLYVFNNLCFNIAVLNLLRNCGMPWSHLLLLRALSGRLGHRYGVSLLLAYFEQQKGLGCLPPL